MRWREDLMDASYDPYCKLCKHKFEFGESAIDHFWREHQTLCWEIESFQRFGDTVMNRFMSNTKIDAEEALQK